VAFGRAGWRVAITARTQAEGQVLAHQLRRPDGTLLAGSLQATAAAVRATGAEVFEQPMDLLDPASLDAAVDATQARWGRIDLLLNNAVYQDRESNALLDGLDDARSNARCTAMWSHRCHLVRRVLPLMVAQGGGQIINVSARAPAPPTRPWPADQGGWGFAYGASKAALARLAGCINIEYRERRIRAFSVNPGLVSTEAVTATLGDGGALEQRYGAMRPAPIAAALVWLATDPRAAELASGPGMIDLQPLVREQGLD
jgi:NAD(P)-dependent dehydrogenase (short-subunit alcohol dehydrogenase family)